MRREQRSGFTRAEYKLIWKHRRTGDLYPCIFHDEATRSEFINSFIVPRGHAILRTWEETV